MNANSLRTDVLRALTALCGAALIFLAACGGGGGDGDGGGGGATPTYTIGGAVTGLSGTVVLRNNGGDNLSVSVNGSFTFATALANGSAYNVTVLTQPAGQTCSVTNGAGTLSGSNVTSVAVACEPATVLYGANGAGGNPSNLYTLNPATGAVATTVGAIGYAVTGLAVHPSTRILYGVTGGAAPVSPRSLITINKTTGVGTLVGGLGATVGDITFTSDGTLYGVANVSQDLVTINLATGAATSVADTTLANFGTGIAASASNLLFFAGQGDNGSLETVNRATGVGTTVATLNGVTSFPIAAMAFNGSTLFGVRLNDSIVPEAELITINTTTAAITVVGASVNRLDAIVFD